ncbi:MAG TPA: TonB-dependent receptor [Rhizomicrobium sp.]|nr:TonB-dependent receptor [Rhizomicrobium sp.]
MSRGHLLKSAALGGVSALALSAPAFANNFDIPGGDLETALNTYIAQTGTHLIVSEDAVRGVKTRGVRGELPEATALARILAGTGFSAHNEAGVIAVVHEDLPLPVTRLTQAAPIRLAAASSAGIESVVVTSSKIKGDIQTVPIAITALSQEQLTSRQIAGGPDLVKEVPNLTFSKTNFTGYNIQIRGIGTQAISVTTDPAVAVAFNDIPFIRNHFFEQEFFDVNQVEVLRGPQGTLYGRNATAGVVNVISAKPTDQFEAMASADAGNYHNRRFEGMINVPIVEDWLDIRVAGEWTKRDGYSFNAITNQPIDGRDLWSTRVSVAWRPIESVRANLVWEHFQENDGRMRTAKQLCKTALPPTSINGTPVPSGSFQSYGGAFNLGNYFSQSCQATSLYSPDAFEVPYGFSLPYDIALGLAGFGNPFLDPYASTTQSRNLRVIESALNPQYRAKNDTLELNVDYAVTPSLTLTSQTGYNQDFLWSTEDFNRFNTSPGIFLNQGGTTVPGGIGFAPGAFRLDPNGLAFCGPNGCFPNGGAAGSPCTSSPSDYGTCESAMIYCDPQLGCSDRIVAEDLSEEHAWQLSQEFRLASNFTGPLNFSVGGNYLHYETEENYYVFINALSIYTGTWGDIYNSGQPSDPLGSNSNCLYGKVASVGYQTWNDPVGGGGATAQDCMYVDTNPISSLNNKGHNYFLSQNPYELNSYAGFGEAYYNIASDLKFTGGLRWTEDRKRFIDIPSEVLTRGYGYPTTGTVNQQWDQLTGRAALNWTPKLEFTDQTLVYGSYAHGYKAGGANPPGAVFGQQGGQAITIADHPKIFKPEFIDAYELGSKNTLLDGALTLNGDIFFYNYKEYQISEIVDRTSINLNFNATVKGAEFETSWEPAPGLKFSFAGGYEGTRIGNGQSAIDLMDRTAGKSDWMIMKPFPTEASNCIFPTYVVQALIEENRSSGNSPDSSDFACNQAYDDHVDPVTLQPYTANPTGPGGIGFPPCANSGCPNVPFQIPAGYPGFDPTQPAINNGEGFAKPLGGNELPNAPHFTTSLTAEYTIPVSEDWAATLHSDFYWQSQSFARVFNDRPYDKIRGYSNVNLALIMTGASGWQVIGYLKNVFNTTAITGAFLNSDDTGLTTNVFLTDPRLFGVRVTKNF